MPTASETTMVGTRFRSNMYLWTALRHFLPADMLRELMFLVVDEVSDHELSLDMLFEERPIASMPGIESWALRQLQTQGELAHYLQRVVQGVAWQSDDTGYPSDKSGSDSQREKAAFLDLALTIGHGDFGLAEREFGKLPDEPGLPVLLQLLRHGAECFAGKQDFAEFVDAAETALQRVERAPAIIVLKHLGDLCADADEWSHAHAFYLRCREILTKEAIPEWGSLIAHLADLVDQSIAAAVRINSGPEEAATLLNASLASGSFDTRPTLTFNAPFDAMSATLNSETLALHFLDSRTTLVRPPLNHDSHHLNASILDQASDNLSNASRRSWAVLRRQVALGLSTESRDTMGMFARVLLQNLNQKSSGRTNPDDFAMAVRFLIQSADRSAVGKIVWTDRLVEFVDQAAIDLVIAFCDRHAGAKLEREQTAIALFGAWTAKLPQERRRLAQPMISFVAARAATGRSSPMGNQDLAVRATDTLIAVAKSRPELCRDSAAPLYEAISRRLLAGTHWNLLAKSLQLASLAVGVLTESQRRDITKGTLHLLETFALKQQFWPVINPALELLVSDEVIALSNIDTEIGGAVVRVIVSLSVDGRTDASGLMYYLERFNSELFEAATADSIAANFVNRLVGSIGKANSSATAGEIQVLLSVPTLSGKEGIRAALAALKTILGSVASNRPSIALAHAYSPVLAMAGRGEAFAEVIGQQAQREEWGAIFRLIREVWTAATNRPQILAPFAIPEPTGPNETIVHNWTYASMRLARDVGEEEQMLTLLQSIEAPALRAAIQLAFATGARSPEAEEGDDLRIETDDAFYAGLGRRLIRVLTGEPAEAAQLCSQLLEQCLRRGPRGLDAGVLAQAHRLEIGADVDKALVHDYMLRVEHDKQLRLSLWPLLTGLS